WLACGWVSSPGICSASRSCRWATRNLRRSSLPMSTEHHGKTPAPNGEPHHADVTFEPVDVEVRTIYWYLIALGVAVALSLLVCVYIFRFTANMAKESDSAPTTAMQQMTEKMSPEEKQAMDYPPEPRLQGVPGHTNDAQEDLRQKLAEDKKAN